MFGIIISVVKSIILILLSILSCLGMWVFFNGDDSENGTICDGVRVCILVLLMIFITVS
nr:MAG TPA: hypothetical protein [Caudoviricetes sp.]